MYLFVSEGHISIIKYCCFCCVFFFSYFTCENFLTLMITFSLLVCGFSNHNLKKNLNLHCWIFLMTIFCLKVITDRKIQNYKKLIHYAESVVCKLSLHHRDKTSTLIGPNKKFTPLYIY